MDQASFCLSKTTARSCRNSCRLWIQFLFSQQCCCRNWDTKTMIMWALMTYNCCPLDKSLIIKAVRAKDKEHSWNVKLHIDLSCSHHIVELGNSIFCYFQGYDNDNFNLYVVWHMKTHWMMKRKSLMPLYSFCNELLTKWLIFEIIAWFYAIHTLCVIVAIL